MLHYKAHDSTIKDHIDASVISSINIKAKQKNKKRRAFQLSGSGIASSYNTFVPCLVGNSSNGRKRVLWL